MTERNAYEPPQAPTDVPPAGDAVAPCPSCKNTSATKVRFTWWGGALGPKLFSVVRCTQCRTRFNGKTGGSLTKVIVVYQLIGLGVAIAIFAAFIAMRR
jgi:hypothetical protein